PGTIKLAGKGNHVSEADNRKFLGIPPPPLPRHCESLMTEPRPHTSVENRLLAAFPRDEPGRLRSSLGPTRLAPEETLYEVGDTLNQAYFIVRPVSPEMKHG